MGSELATGFDCSICGKHHNVLPLSFSIKAPHSATLIPVEEMEQRLILTPDQCVIDDRDFYLRGRIPIPVLGLDEPFIWGVWAEISPKNFVRTIELWKSPGREELPQYPGWLDNEITLFGDTINLQVDVQTQVVGRRPHFVIADPDHPLAMEQRDGISMERVKAIAEHMSHPPAIPKSNLDQLADPDHLTE